MGWGAGGSCTPRPPIRQQPAETRVITVIFLGLLLDLLAFTLLLPLLPGLLENHSRAHDPLYGSWQQGVDWFAAAIGMPAEKRYNSVLFGGLIGSIFSVLQFLSAPLTGATSDCLGRRPVMLLSLGDRWHQQGERQPLHGHCRRPGLATCPQPRHVIGVAFSLGFTLGPMLGASLPVRTAPWLALLFAVSDLLFLFCFLPETLPPEKRAPSISLGFRAAADLLSPLALLRFSAVAHGQDPPTGDRLRHLRRLGLVYFLYLFLFSGLEFTLSFLAHQRFQFSRAAALTPRPPQSAAGEDVLLHRSCHGHHPGHLHPAHQPWQGNRGCEASHPAAGPRLPSHRLGVHAAHAGPGAAALLLRRCCRGALPVFRGRWLWLAWAEGHGHGHAAEPGRPGQGAGAHGGRLSVLAGGRAGLLHRERGALPAPLPSPAEPDGPSTDAQGRVAEPARPQTGGSKTGMGGAQPGPLRAPGPSPGGHDTPPPRPSSGTWAAPPTERTAGSVASTTFQAFGLLVYSATECQPGVLMTK
ncbi:major facilitator superfamily domain-containing protein 10 isoform X2 [Pteropus vampyrus]|uniref:Major facilitator superfamily domain-containing protein 10 isoform X2 n=1 Tax=Pteropus vampyrus TaxID=132908 RepID=A0A6P3RD47_PTEVA|nr:major facilitator superfamily domain-containing protein 10 isoform X2 [Pteropus vampyrus]